MAANFNVVVLVQVVLIKIMARDRHPILLLAPQLAIKIDLRKSIRSAKKGISKIGKKKTPAGETDGEATEDEGATPDAVPDAPEIVVQPPEGVSSMESSVDGVEVDTEGNLTSSTEVEAVESASSTPGEFRLLKRDDLF